MVIPVSQQNISYALRIARELRTGGQAVELEVSEHGVSTGLKLAARQQMQWAAIVGEEEERTKTITWHNLQNGEEERVTLAQLTQRKG